MTMRGRKNSKQYMDYNFFDLILTGCFMQVKSKFLFGVSNKIGALLNSKINMELSWASTCEKHNLSVDFEDYFSKIGRPFNDILNILNIKENQGNIEQTFNEISIQLIRKVSFYDGIKSVLDQLSKKPYFDVMGYIR